MVYKNHCDHCYATRVSMYLDGFLYCSEECAIECRAQGCWSSL